MPPSWLTASHVRPSALRLRGGRMPAGRQGSRGEAAGKHPAGASECSVHVFPPPGPAAANDATAVYVAGR